MKKVLATVCFILCSFMTFHGDCSAQNVNVTNAQTPTQESKSGLKWSRSFSDGALANNSIPILAEEGIYLVAKNKLYLLSYKDGSIQKQLTLTASCDSVCNLLYENEKLYIPLHNGIVECVDTKNFSSLWQSEAFGGQSLSTLSSYNGMLYGASTSIQQNKTTGVLYCLSESTGQTIWSYSNANGGYYWSGPYVMHNRLYVADDDGTLMIHSLTSDEIYESIKLTDANIRAGFTYDESTNALFTTTNKGEIIQIVFDKENEITDTRTLSLSSSSRINCTSTPTIYNGRLYVGSMIDGYGTLSVVDTKNMKCLYQAKAVKGGEIKSSPLLTTAYGNEWYLYFTCNITPGDIYVMKDSAGATSGEINALFLPETNKQYCLSSVAAGKDGVLYYSNDSGTLFAVESQPNKVVSTPTPAPVVQRQSSPQKTAKITIKKPTKVKLKKTKKGYTLSWKSQKKLTTFIYMKKGKKKWKKVAKTTKTFYRISKKKRGYQIRIRCGKKNKSKWYYSKYTTAKKIK
ncbi:MAG: PQQ-binding-like beta-propeller repeat protein [Eubacterium sp.]|nr:PQQ-binding-like beta-propeller repeat protein [Eubacterium sp.]